MQHLFSLNKQRLFVLIFSFIFVYDRVTVKN